MKIFVRHILQKNSRSATVLPFWSLALSGYIGVFGYI